ncbi:probable helicase CHR10 isoform X3 [Zingiber officinale]|uniref:probable helicase CHR10 isoform X3 n=1 Tax=Zingiber officinale TaxID=94328 RepID=UPI001C4B4789|nr:probable helicase CHR10 isoform X3 [Zingiber officinale]
MDYERRLLLAANLVLSSDRSYEPPPEPYELGITAVLKPHQIEGLSWLIRRYHLGVNVVLGDEMGLGKTLQAISFLSYLKAQSLSCGPFLVMCPLSVTDGWMSEFNKFCSTLRVILYVGDKKHRHNLRNSMHETLQRQSSSSNELPFDVLLTTYDITLLDQDFLSQIPWGYAVIDEAQRLKNPSSVLYNVLEHNFVMPRRLLLTGTPIQNNLSELWALMHFCMPSIFGTSDQFISTFKEAGSSSAGTESYSVKRQFRILRYILNAFMLRRTKALLVERGTLTLPPVTEMTVMVPLIPLQRKVYMSILRKELQTLLSLSLGSTSNQSLQNIVMQLRKTCSHPYLFSGIEPEPYEEGEHLIQASGKLIILDLLLLKLHKFGHRVLLFAQMTRTLDILQDFMELRKYSYERLDGSVRSEERFAAIRSFSYQASKDDSNNQVNHDVPFVFMISTRAGGVGLNLIAADTGKRRHLPEEYQQKREADKKKAEEKQLGRWEALGYKTLAVEEPNMLVEISVLSDQGAVQFVYGDCTNPSKVCQSEPAIIFSCVDNSGNWGHGGMFNSLANLSSYIPDAYHRAFECGDLHMGDLHLIKLNASSGDESIVQHCPMWVALAVVQSYNPRRKVPRSNISMSDLEGCLSKASFAAAQNSASIHMPRIGYQDGSQHSEWYTMERLLRKYASMHGINIYVYYYRRPSRDQ